MKALYLPSTILYLFIASLSLKGQPDAILTNPSACNLNLPISDNNCLDNGTFFQPNDFRIVVDQAPGTVLGQDVYLQEVRLIINHTWVNDLDISLQSPGGQIVDLSSDNGGSDDNYGDSSTGDCSVYTSFQYGACTSITSGVAPFTDQIYAPEESFLSFNDGLTSPIGDWTLFICDDLLGDVGSLEFVELVFAPIACLVIEDVFIEAIDSTTVFLGYEPSNFCGTIIAEFGPPGFSPASDSSTAGGQVQILSCGDLTLSGLTEDSTFDLYLRRYCDETGQFSPNTCSISFTTGCNPGSATALEDFDAEASCFTFCGVVCPLTGDWRNVLGDDFDWIVNSGATLTPGTGPEDDITIGGNYIYIETNGNNCASGESAMLYSSCFNLDKAGKDSCHLSFNYHMRGISVGSLRLQASDDGGFNWQTLWQENGDQGEEWKKAYISLNQYPQGAGLQLRFEATKGLGVYGDIGLDHIQLYGSQFGSFPDQEYYVDNDGDGYGVPGPFIISCLTNPPAGYAPNDTDCVDNDPLINPGQEEIPCNGIDENCNAATIDDDPFLPSPEVLNDTICSGELATICANIQAGNLVAWFNDLEGTQFLSSDSCYTFSLPVNGGPSPIVYHYYAREINLSGCFSPVLGEATVVVNPNPAGWLATPVSICPGDTFNLNALDLRDSAFTNANINYYQGYPISPANEISDPLVAPTETETYAYLLESPEGCLDSGLFDITVLPVPELSFMPSDSFSVCLDGVETLTAIASSGAGDYQYIWTNGATTANIAVTGQGTPGDRDTLGVTVTDAAGCVAEGEVMILTTNSIDSVRVLTNPVTNCGGSDGSFSVIPLNGSSPFTYMWSGSDGSSDTETVMDTFTLSNLSEGAFRVTITDASAIACEVRLRNIRVQGPGFEVNEPNFVFPACTGDSTGQICLNVSGSGNLSYNWSTGESSVCIENLPAGFYQVTISNGPCTTVEEYEIVEPGALNLSPKIVDASCFDAADGSVLATAFGGTAPYQLTWDDGFVGSARGGLISGPYPVTLRDDNNCLFLDTILVGAPDTLIIAIDSFSNISCPGAEDAYIQLSGEGGQAAYSFSWQDEESSALRFDLVPNDYQVTMTDALGCTVSSSFQINNPDTLRISVNQLVQPLCNGDNTGQILLSTEGGTGPFTYLWNEFFTTNAPLLSSLEVGLYSVVAEDVNGCFSDTLSINLSSASQLDLVVNEQMPVCVGDSTGSLVLSPGGQGPFQYAWNTGDTTNSLQDLAVGSYSVTIIDGEGCIYDSTLVLSAPQVFDIIPVVSQPSCAGTEDGIINLIIQQSGPGSLFQWSDGSQHAQRFNLMANDYSFTVTDINGCSYQSDTFQLIDPPQLNLEILEMGGLRCVGDTTGFIETDITGGTPPYDISWVGQGVTDPSIYGLSAGAYRLLVFDSRGCPLDTTIMLPEATPITATASLLNGGMLDNCVPGIQDTLFATAIGGMEPYSFNWGDTITGATYINPPPNDYALTVTDANGCFEVLPTLKVPERIPALQLDSFVVKGVSCFAGNDASMTAYTSGGSGDLQYAFSPTFTDITDTNIVSHTGLAHFSQYSVTVTDRRTNCIVMSDPISPTQPLPITISRDEFDVVNCFGGSDGALFVSVFGGTMPYQYEWYRMDTLIANTEDLPFAQSGIYRLEVTDSLGCRGTFIDSSVVTINEVIRVVDSLSVFEDASCEGGATGSITPFIDGGAPPYQFEWSNGSMEPALIDIPAGFYSLTITDSDTCRAIFQDFIIDQPDSEIEVTDTTVVDVSCFDFNDGSITLNVVGGSPPYEYVWRRDNILLTNLTGPSQDQLFAGSYQIEIRDSVDCLSVIELTLNSPPELSGGIGQIPPDTGNTLYAFAEGGVPPYSYLWSNESTQDTLSNLSNGNYFLTITDDSGCTIEVSLVLNNLRALDPSGGQLAIYPNPSTEDFFIDWNKDYADQLDIQVIDLRGRLVWQINTNVQAGEQLRIYPGDLPSGVYLVKLRDGQGRYYSGLMIRD